MDFNKMLSQAKIGLLGMDKMVFFSTIVLGFKHVIDNSVSTAYTNGLMIGYNEKFFESLDKAERMFLIAHESMHIVLEHCTARAAGMNAELWNKAADYVINLILTDAGMKMPQGGLLDSQYRNMSTLQVYRLLEEDEKNGNKTPDNMMKGQALGDIKETPKDQQAEASSNIEEVLMRGKVAAQMAGQEPGSLGADLQRLFDRMTKPAIPWQRLLQRFFNSINKDDYSWKRPNRRYMPDLYLPSLHSPAMGSVDFAIDTSGSITDNIFNYFMSETHHVLKRFKPEFIRVMQFDHVLESTDIIRNPRDLKKLTIQGGGGTNVEEAMEAFAANKSQAMFVLTDGYLHTRHLTNPKKPVIWCVYENTDFVPTFGQVVHFKMGVE